MSGSPGAPEAPSAGRISPGIAGEVAAHTRPSRLRSIRIRIVFPVVLAVTGLVALGAIQSRDALDEANAGQRARLLARAAATAVSLVHQVELEYSEINLLRQRGGTAGVQLLTAAQARTDVARGKFNEAARRVRQVEPAINSALDDAARAINLLPALRNLQPAGADSSAYLFDVYDDIVHETIGVADAVAGQLSDPRLVEIARSFALAADLEHLAAEQLDLGRQIFARQQIRPGELVELSSLAGSEHQQVESLERLTGPSAERFKQIVSGADVKKADQLRDAVLSNDAAPETLQVDADVWHVTQTGKLRRLRLVEIALSGAMEKRAYEIQAAAEKRALITGGLTLGVVVLTLAGAILLAVRTSRRLRRVRDAALTLARAELPGAVARVTAASNAEVVRGALHDSAARMDAMLTSGSDEIGELNVAFGAVHRQALRLAADQALLRMEIEAMFVALSRRGQTLVQRQIHLIEDFGRAERDASRLARIFAMEHVTTRMRRNEENLLVLAGGEPGRRFLAPVPIRDVVEAAADEIEDDARVQATAMPPLAVMAHAVGDVIHLLAELLENAANFSPPTTKVRVTARQTVEYLSITVYDEGIGMPPDKLAEANERLARPSALTSTLVGTMGLLVVARLARRHGIHVQLSSTPGGGTAATVGLPESILAPSPADDHLRRARAYGSPTSLPVEVTYQVPVLPQQRAGDAVPFYLPVGAARVDEILAGRPTIFTTSPNRPVHYATHIDVAVRTHEDVPPHTGGELPAAPPAPNGPQPNGPVPIEAAQPAPDGFTAAGLPRRQAGGALVGPDGTPPPTGAAAPTGAERPAGPPDPDVARARLASLASGIAAAQRRGQS